MAHTASAKGAIIQGLQAFTSILIACFIFRTERMNALKWIGGLIGVAGVVVVNWTKDGFGGGMRLIAVTLHDGSDWADHTALYDYGFAVCRRECAVKRFERCGEIARGGATVTAVAKESFFYPVLEGEELSVRAELPDTLDLPVKRGQTLGELVILCNGTEVGRVALVSAGNVEAPAKQAQKETKKTPLAERLWDFFAA